MIVKSRNSSNSSIGRLYINCLFTALFCLPALLLTTQDLVIRDLTDQLDELNRTRIEQINELKQATEEQLLQLGRTKREELMKLGRIKTEQFAELKRISENQLDRATEELMSTYSNYLLQTPKTGGVSLMNILKKHRTELSVLSDARVCNHNIATGLIDGKTWENWGNCWLHTAESVFSFAPARRFAVVRNPFHLVPSMFYHCKESKDHATESHYMPANLTEWLDAWLIGNDTNGFHCYKITNPQSNRVLKGLENLDVGFVLSNLFDSVGLTEEMSKSACLISIDIHRRVPSSCDCTSGQQPANGKAEVRSDHGVAHHGDNLNLTEHEKDAIATLAAKDIELYNTAQTIFWNKVEHVEKQYAFTMC